jgi:sporulation protein YlmC with PRC-barrel domain
VHLVRDLLDQEITDRNGREMGRVDRVVLELRPGSRPRVVAIDVGAPVLAERLNRAFGRWVAGMLHTLIADAGQPLRIPVGDILSIKAKVAVDLPFGETAAAVVERTLRSWITRLPGAKR